MTEWDEDDRRPPDCDQCGGYGYHDFESCGQWFRVECSCIGRKVKRVYRNIDDDWAA